MRGWRDRWQGGALGGGEDGISGGEVRRGWGVGTGIGRAGSVAGVGGIGGGEKCWVFCEAGTMDTGIHLM